MRETLVWSAGRTGCPSLAGESPRSISTFSHNPVIIICHIYSHIYPPTAKRWILETQAVDSYSQPPQAVVGDTTWGAEESGS